MRLMKGNSSSGVVLVQSPPSLTRSSGFGAMMAASSASQVPPPASCTGMPLSQGHPPSKWLATCTTGAEALMRSSSRVSSTVCVPPPLPPLAATRVVSMSRRFASIQSSSFSPQAAWKMCARALWWSPTSAADCE